MTFVTVELFGAVEIFSKIIYPIRIQTSPDSRRIHGLKIPIFRNRIGSGKSRSLRTYKRIFRDISSDVC